MSIASALTARKLALVGRDDEWNTFTSDEPPRKLQHLVLMRNVAIVGQILTVYLAVEVLDIELPLVAIAATIVALAIFNFATWRRLHGARPVTDRELLFQLSIDVAALTVLLGLSGGAANPFTAMYLLPLAIAATSLPAAFAWGIAVATVLCYTLLLFVSVPLFSPGEEARYIPRLVAGMWVTYIITAGMIAHFVVRIASSRRREERVFAAAREKALCDEHIVRIGTLAAGAAHELSSPLTAMAVMIEGLRETLLERPDAQRTLDVIAQQLAGCRDTLLSLLAYGHCAFDTEHESLPFDTCMRRCLDEFRSRRPDAVVAMSIDTPGTPPKIHVDLALRQALFSLLNNAADVSPNAIEVRLGWDCENLRIVVRDHGPGIAPEVEDRLGELFFTTKVCSGGSGLGLYLANTAIVRFGGTLRLGNAEGGGAAAEVFLPVAAMSPLDLNLHCKP